MGVLDGVQETMLIPLVIKANETRRKNARIQDLKAVEMVEQLSVDTVKYDKFMSHEGVVARTIIFDDALQAYLKKYPNAVCISIGCGLDARFTRVDNQKILWYDLDFPEVISIRKKFFSENDRVHMIAKSALDATWPNEVEKREKTIILMEGILMYFSESEVKQLFQIIQDNFKDVIVLAELMHPGAVKGSKHHDTVKHTNAVFRWGIKSGKELEQICPGFYFVKEKSFNSVMKKYTIRGKLFASLPVIRNYNDRLAIFSFRKNLKK